MTDKPLSVAKALKMFAPGLRKPVRSRADLNAAEGLVRAGVRVAADTLDEARLFTLASTSLEPVPDRDDPVRECRECTACCSTMSIPSLDKPSCRKCKHQSSSCDIYESRPKECSTYSCWWRRGFGEEADRPDKLGVILDAACSTNQEIYEDLPFVQVREVRTGVLDAAIGPEGCNVNRESRVASFITGAAHVGYIVMFWRWNDPNVLARMSDFTMPLLAARGVGMAPIPPSGQE